MLWFPLSLLSAFAQATTDALTKKALGGTDYFMVAWLRNILAVPFLFVALLFVPIPQPDSTFYVAVAAALPLEIISTLLYTRALEISPLSLTMPFLALTPLYLLLTSFILLGEVPSTAGAVGVCLLGSGAYLLNAHTVKGGGIFAPFKAVYREKGSMMMMAVAAIFAITSDLSKVAIMHSSPLFFAAFYLAAFSAVFTPVALYLTKTRLSAVKSGMPGFLMIGAALAATSIFQNFAMQLTQVSYMIAVKRTSLLFSIGYGYFLFRERNISVRFLGGAVMLAGLVVMALF
jgi:drug/metabolite transporter (DMT)-like permease